METVGLLSGFSFYSARRVGHWTHGKSKHLEDARGNLALSVVHARRRIWEPGRSLGRAAADGPGGSRVPVRLGHGQLSEAQLCRRPSEGSQRRWVALKPANCSFTLTVLVRSCICCCKSVLPSFVLLTKLCWEFWTFFLTCRPHWPDWRTDVCRLWGPEKSVSIM